MSSRTSLRIRTDLRPGDLGRIVAFHGRVYPPETGWDLGFEAYVAEGVGRFGSRYNPDRERVWLAERGTRLTGCIAIVSTDEGPDVAQLRWFLVHPEERGQGVGRTLLDAALQFCRETRRRRVFLWTVHTQDRAAALYRAAGFTVTRKEPRELWGTTLTEVRYDLRLRHGSD